MGASFADVLAAALAENQVLRAESPRASGFESPLASAQIATLRLDVPSWAETLNVSPFAEEHDLRRAYKRRAFETHPDRGGNAQAFIAAKSALDEALSSLLEAPGLPMARAAAAYR